MAKSLSRNSDRFFSGLYLALSPSADMLWHKTILPPTAQLSLNPKFKRDRRKIAEPGCMWLFCR
jgi:hypothetical protein